MHERKELGAVKIDDSPSARVAIQLDFASRALDDPDPDPEAAVLHAETASEILQDCPPEERADVLRRAEEKRGGVASDD